MSDCSRREFLAVLAAAPAVLGRPRALVKDAGGFVLGGSSRDRSVRSPNGRVVFELIGDGNLYYQVTTNGRNAIETSPMRISVDGIDLTRGAAIERAEEYRIQETYAWRGVHSSAHNRCRGSRFHVAHTASGNRFVLDVRAYDDGVAFRFILPGNGSRTPDEATVFTLPTGSVVWYHDLGGHYEGSYARRDIGEVQSGGWAAPPLTAKLPGGAGYLSITEGALVDYPGMALQADGQRGFRVQLGHAHPLSYPFTLRYAADTARVTRPAAITGMITTPWRIVMLGSGLDALVNCDIVHNVAAPPDKRLFPEGLDTSWVKPGRAVWKYLDGGGENTLATMKEFSRLAGLLGFEYHVVEGFWQRWPEADQRELIEYSRQQKVGVWLWKHTRELRDPAAREEFFSHVQKIGAVGVKLDFLDHEAKEIIDLYQELLKGAAEHRLMVNFHGSNKPTGESRTWPNELTREAVSGMERRSMQTWSAHTTTLPFTRMLAGPLDFTPMLFGDRRRETSWPHQIATAALFDSPLLTYGAHPQSILDNPAVEMIRSIPPVWDETRVLPESEIGELAAFVRRRGKTWFVVVANGPSAQRLRVPLTFLGRGRRDALIVRDDPVSAAAVVVEHAHVRRGDTLDVALREAGGFLARIS